MDYEYTLQAFNIEDLTPYKDLLDMIDEGLDSEAIGELTREDGEILIEY